MEEKYKEPFTYTLAFWLLRFWLATRAIFTGLVKFQGMKDVVKPEYADLDAETLEALGPEAYNKVAGLGLDMYQALPAKGPMSVEGYMASPLMPSFMVGPYAAVLGYALIGLGITLLLGICTRLSLFFMGLLYISLTYGFIILEKSLGEASAAGAAYLGVHMVLIAVALVLAKYNRFEVFSDRKIGCFLWDCRK